MIVFSDSNINNTAILIVFGVRDIIIEMRVEKNGDTLCG